MKRRNVLAALGALATAGCTKIGKTEWFGGLVDGAEKLMVSPAETFTFIANWSGLVPMVTDLPLMVVVRGPPAMRCEGSRGSRPAAWSSGGR